MRASVEGGKCAPHLGGTSTQARITPWPNAFYIFEASFEDEVAVVAEGYQRKYSPRLEKPQNALPGPGDFQRKCFGTLEAGGKASRLRMLVNSDGIN